jgi:opacity protein-like surface antigen
VSPQRLTHPETEPARHRRRGATASAVAAVLFAGMTVPPAAAAGLYLRSGDSGPLSAALPTAPDPSGGPVGTYLRGDFGSPGLLAGTAGYRFSPLLRGDINFLYRPGPGLGDDPLAAVPSGRSGTSSAGGLISTQLDLGGFVPRLLAPFEPFVGAGIGYARSYADTMAVTAPALASLAQPGDLSTGPALMLTAETGITVTPSVTLGLGYKFIDVGEARGGLSAAGAGSDTTRNAGLRAHEFTFGVRVGF